MRALIWLAVLAATPALSSGPFYCAGVTAPPSIAAKTAAPRPTRSGTRNALVVFARFLDSGDSSGVPEWAPLFFDHAKPGSLSHFYDTMSGGRLRVRGDVAPRIYHSSRPARSYLAASGRLPGGYGDLVRDILPQIDQDVDFRRFDNDGPDGLPDSGDDDGLVDAIFVILADVPTNFLQGSATGIANLGLSHLYETADEGSTGTLRIASHLGTVLRGRTFVEAVGVGSHEYGHLLGLPDLFDRGYQRSNGALPPEEDAAGIGAWGLMGWGALGWRGDDGPASLSAWSREFLGWARTQQLSEPRQAVALADVGLSGDVLELPLSAKERFLLEYRSRRSSYYDRNLPGEGLLIWHDQGSSLRNPYEVDLESADGLWADVGYPAGRVPAPLHGEDNLDFWAHDAAYARKHVGNLGDATDPFDGVRWQSFTPETNPSSHDETGQRSVRVEQIRVARDSIHAVVATVPPRLGLTWSLDDANDDRVLSPGEEAALQLRVSNRGGVRLTDLAARVISLDTLVSVANASVTFDDLDVGRVTGLPRTGPATLSASDFAGRRVIELSVRVTSAQTTPLDTVIHVEGIASIMLQGRVLTASGEPVPNIRVSSYSTPNSYQATTDSDGSFRMRVLPGAYTVNVRPPPPYLSAFRYLRMPEDTTLDIVLAEGVPFSGTVTDTTGQPVANALVRVNSQSAQTNAQGRFRLSAPAGSQTITITSFQELPTLTRRIIVSEGSEYSFVVGPGLTLRVTFVSVDAASSAVQSFLAGPLGGGGTLSTGAQAIFQVNPGYQWLSVIGGRNQTGFAVLLNVRHDADVSFDLPSRHTISGTLVDRSAVPFLASSVTFRSETAPVQATSNTDSDGTFAAELRPGSYTVRFDPEDGSAPGQILDTVFVESDATIEVEPRDGVLHRGRLLMSSGTPAGKTRILLLSPEARAWTTATSDGDGLFEAWTVTGPWGLSVRRDSLLYWHPPATLSPAFFLEEVQTAGRLFAPATDGPPSLVVSTDDPLSAMAVVTTANEWPRYYLVSDRATSAASTGHDGLFRLPGRRRYVVAMPSRGTGVGVVLDLQQEDRDPMALEIRWPTSARDTLFGEVTSAMPVNVGESVLTLYDADAGVIARTSVGRSSGAFILPVPRGTYTGHLALLDPHLGFGGQFELGTVSVSGDKRWDIHLTDVTTAVSSSSAVPEQTCLAPNYPNPFNATTTFPFRIQTDRHVELSVFDVLGRRVAGLVDEDLARGNYTVVWDGTDDLGHETGTGVYFARLQAGSFLTSTKLLLR
jgi:M6 family metalloprotease-like protein